MIRVGVFTRNKAKVAGVKKAFQDFFRDVEVSLVYSKDVEIPSQPLRLEELLRGAYKRATYLYRSNGFEYSVGLEGGVFKIESNRLKIYFGVQLAMLINRTGRYSLGLSSSFNIPENYLRDIGRKELAEILYELTGSMEARHSHGFVGYITNNRIDRVTLSYEAVRNALAAYLAGNYIGIISDDVI